MKEQKLFDAVTNLPDEFITEAAIPKQRKKRFKKWMIPVAAAVVALVYTFGSVLWPDGATLGMVAHAAYLAEYPDRVQAARIGGISRYYKITEAWNAEQKTLSLPGDFDTNGLNSFVKAATLEFFGSNRDQNCVYSPVSVYMALCMLAETTDSGSRGQVLELLGVSDIQTLRKEANTLWNNVYRDDGKMAALLANSIWLRDDTKYVDETLKFLAENYYVSSFEGKMGSGRLNSALQDWMNANTNDLLKEQISDIKLTSDTVIALISTIYYKGTWAREFSPQHSTTDTFHGVNGDEQVTFLNQGLSADYYWSKNFAATKKALSQSGMWLVLPDEGVSPEQLLSDDSFWDMVQGGSSVENKNLMVDLSVPKFDISDQIDLTEGLKALGVTEVFTEEPYLGDFSPLTKDTRWDKIFVSQVLHGARLKIDEEGCEGAAYTVVSEKQGAAMPSGDRVELKLDRPFVFVLTNNDNVPLFVGIVHNP